MFIIANDQIIILSKVEAREKTLSKVREIANAIDEVYLEGKGAKRYVLISFPAGVEEGSFKIVNNTVTIKLFGTDISQKVNAPVPDTTLQIGSYYLEIVSYGDIVSVGVPVFSASPTRVNLIICSPASQTNLTQNITFKNNVNETITIDIQKEWTASDVNLSVQDQLNLLPNESKEVELNFSISPNVIGIRSGTLIANTSIENKSYSTKIEIYLNIVSCAGAGVSYLVINTYKDSDYSIESSSFNLPLNVTIATGNWIPNSWITIDLRYPNASSVPGYPKSVQVNESGEYSEIWTALGPLGNYTIYVNDSSRTVNRTFTLVCT